MRYARPWLKSVKDPGFKSDMSKMDMDVDPLSGPDVTELVSKVNAGDARDGQGRSWIIPRRRIEAGGGSNTISALGSVRQQVPVLVNGAPLHRHAVPDGGNRHLAPAIWWMSVSLCSSAANGKSI